MKRLFIGIGIPDSAKDHLQEIQRTGSKRIERARWVDKVNLHLTLQFLGNCEEDLIPEIAGGMKEAVKSSAAFDFTLGGLGAFPNPRKARVFWMGVSQGEEEIGSLQKSVEKELVPLGFLPEKRRFHAHITLARLKMIQDVTKVIEDTQDFRYSDAIKVGKITLFESQLKRSGAVYTVLEEIMLENG